MSTQPIKSDSKMLYLQARYQFEKAKDAFESGQIKTETQLIQNVFQSFEEFFTSVGKPNMVPRYAPEGGPPWSEDYNLMMDEIKQDLEMLFAEVDSLGRALYTDFNHNMVQQEILTQKFEGVLDKMKDLELYSGVVSGKIQFARDSFLNKDKIDYDRISGTPLEVTNGSVSLPMSIRENVSGDAKVTIIAGNSERGDYILGTESNGFPGNNTEIHTTTDGVLTSQNYAPTFIGEQSNHGNYAGVLDGSPNTWFEYEKVNVREHDRVVVAKNIGWDYRVFENTTIKWAADPTNGVLKLHMQIMLPEEKMINQINVNMYTPPNYGAKTAIVKDVLITDGKVPPQSVLPANKQDTDYNFNFEPKKAKVISVLFEQPDKYMTDIGHVYYEQKSENQATDQYAMDSVSQKHGNSVRVDGPIISLQDIGINVNVSDTRVEAKYPLLESSNTEENSMSTIISRLTQGVTAENVDIGIEKFEGWRWAIGIRDIELYACEYEEEGELVSKPFYFDKPVDKISLDVDELLPDSIVQNSSTKYDFLKYFVSIDDGGQWHPITPMNHQIISDDQPPKIYTVRTIQSSDQQLQGKSGYIESEYPVYSIRLKVVGTRPEESDMRMMADGDAAPSTAEQVSPILNSYNMQILTEYDASDSLESYRLIAGGGENSEPYEPPVVDDKPQDPQPDLGCDPTNPWYASDPSSPCYQPDCDPTDPNSWCYCDPDDPISWCNQEKPQKPEEECDPTDPFSDCYVPPEEEPEKPEEEPYEGKLKIWLDNKPPVGTHRHICFDHDVELIGKVKGPDVLEKVTVYFNGQEIDFVDIRIEKGNVKDYEYHIKIRDFIITQYFNINDEFAVKVVATDVAGATDEENFMVKIILCPDEEPGDRPPEGMPENLDLTVSTPQANWCIGRDIILYGYAWGPAVLSRLEVYMAINGKMELIEEKALFTDNEYYEYTFTRGFLESQGFNQNISNRYSFEVRAFDTEGAEVRKTFERTTIDCTEIEDPNGYPTLEPGGGGSGSGGGSGGGSGSGGGGFGGNRPGGGRPGSSKPGPSDSAGKKERITITIDKLERKVCICQDLIIKGTVEGPNPITEVTLFINGQIVNPRDLGSMPADLDYPCPVQPEALIYAKAENDKLGKTFYDIEWTIPYWKLLELGIVIGDEFIVLIKAKDAQAEDAFNRGIAMSDCEDEKEEAECLETESVIIAYFNPSKRRIIEETIPVTNLPYNLDNGNGVIASICLTNKENFGPTVQLVGGNDESGFAFQVWAAGVNYYRDVEKTEIVTEWASLIYNRSEGVINPELMLGNPKNKNADEWITAVANGDYSQSPTLTSMGDFVNFSINSSYAESQCNPKVNCKPVLPEPPVVPSECLELTDMLIQYFDTYSKGLRIVRIPINQGLTATYLVTRGLEIRVAWMKDMNAMAIEITEGEGIENLYLTAAGIMYKDENLVSQTAWATIVRWKSNGVQNPEFATGGKKTINDVTWVEQGIVNNTYATYVGSKGDMVAYTIDSELTERLCDTIPEQPEIPIEDSKPTITFDIDSLCIYQGVKKLPVDISDSMLLKEYEYEILVNDEQYSEVVRRDVEEGYKQLYLYPEINQDTLSVGDVVVLRVKVTNEYGSVTEEKWEGVVENCDKKPPVITFEEQDTICITEINDDGTYCLNFNVTDNQDLSNWQAYVKNKAGENEWEDQLYYPERTTDTGSVEICPPIILPEQVDIQTMLPQRADIVFLIDTSGSMNNQSDTGIIGNIRKNMTRFMNYLRDNGFNVWIGYADSNFSDQYYQRLDLSPAHVAAENFKVNTKPLPIQTNPNGTPGQGWEGMQWRQIMDPNKGGYSFIGEGPGKFRLAAKKHFVLVTDTCMGSNELNSPLGSPEAPMHLIQDLIEKNITVSAIRLPGEDADPVYDPTVPPFDLGIGVQSVGAKAAFEDNRGDYTEIVTRTGGILLDVNAPDLWIELQKLANEIIDSQSYTPDFCQDVIVEAFDNAGNKDIKTQKLCFHDCDFIQPPILESIRINEQPGSVCLDETHELTATAVYKNDDGSTFEEDITSIGVWSNNNPTSISILDTDGRKFKVTGVGAITFTIKFASKQASVALTMRDCTPPPVVVPPEEVQGEDMKIRLSWGVRSGGCDLDFYGSINNTDEGVGHGRSTKLQYDSPNGTLYLDQDSTIHDGSGSSDGAELISYEGMQGIILSIGIKDYTGQGLSGLSFLPKVEIVNATTNAVIKSFTIPVNSFPGNGTKGDFYVCDINIQAPGLTQSSHIISKMIQGRLF